MQTRSSSHSNFRIVQFTPRKKCQQNSNQTINIFIQEEAFENVGKLMAI